MGAAAILFGSVVALRQERLKLLVVYSTVAQIGYLFLMFPLAFSPAAAKLQGGDVLSGGILQAISHATAKASMFMTAGLIYTALGHDRIGGLAGLGRALPMSVLTFTLAGADRRAAVARPWRRPCSSRRRLRASSGGGLLLSRPAAS